MPANLVGYDGIELNGVAYPIVEGSRSGPRSKTDVTPFAPKTSSGPPKYGDFTLSSHETMRDFRSGMSQLFTRDDKQARYWHSTCDMGFANQVTLLPLFSAVNGPFQSSVSRVLELAGNIYAFTRGNGIFKTTGGASPTFASASSTTISIQAALLYSPNGGSETAFAFDNSGTGYRHSTDGTTWTSKTAPATNTRAAVEFDRKLVIITDSGAYYSLDPSGGSPTWAQITTAVPGTCLDAVTYIDEQNDEAVILLTTTGLWRLNVFAQTYTLLRRFEGSILSPTTVGAVMVVHNGAVMVPTRRGILRWTYSGQTWIGPNRDDGFETNYFGYPHYLFSDGEYLYCNLAPVSTAQNTQLLRYDEMGWHRFMEYQDGSGDPLTGAVNAFFRTSLGATTDTQRFYVFTGRLQSLTLDWGWFETPLTTSNPLMTSAQSYARKGQLITSWADLGFAEIPKGLYIANLNYRLTATDSGHKITLQYAIDQNASWTALGSVTGNVAAEYNSGLISTKPFGFGSSGEGIAANIVRFRALLERGSTATATPVLMYVTLQYVARPDTGFSFDQVIDLSPDALENFGMTYDEAVINLEAARASVPMVTYKQYLDSPTTFYVLVTNIPAFLEEDHGLGVRYGTMRVRCAEVV